jgi:carbon-monoxide dehydrogenase medium subunit
MVGVAAVVIVGAGNVIERAGIGVTGVSDHPYRATAVEDALTGTTGSADDIAAAAANVVGGREVNSDIHASAEYRAAMAAVYTRRAIQAALARQAQ